MATDPIPRRSFLDYLLGSGFLAAVIAAAYPVISYLSPRKISQAEQNEVIAAQVVDLKPNSGKIFKFGDKPGLLIMTPSGVLRAFTAVCTHLGCTVEYRSDLKLIYCACHGGEYDLFGKNIAGPPPLPLEEYDVVIRDSEIVVRKKA